MSVHDLSELELDRLTELAHVGGSWAANALAKLAGRTILTRVPVVHGPDRFRMRGEWSSGIFCDIEGALCGTVGVFLSPESRRILVRLLCGSDESTAEVAASALSEFGNILCSQTASAMADLVGGVILPGLPELVLDDAESVFESRVAPRHGRPRPIYIASELFDREGKLRALHVMVPEISKAAAPR